MHLDAAVYRVLDWLRRSNPDPDGGLNRALDRYPFLRDYVEPLTSRLPDRLTWDDALPWWEEQILEWESPAQDQPRRLPLVSLAQHAGIDFTGRMSFVALGLIEEDPRFGRLFSDWNAAAPDGRPTLNTVAALAQPGTADAWSVSSVLIQTGLIVVLNGDAPRSEWIAKVPSDIWEVVRGDAVATLASGAAYVAPGTTGIDDLILPPPLHRRLRQLPTLLASGEAGAVIVRGMRGSDRRLVARAVATELELGTLEVDPTIGPLGDSAPIAALAAASGAVPVLAYDLPPGEVEDVPRLVGYRGPIIVLLGPEGGVRGPAVERAVTLELPPPSAAERLQHWERALGAGRSRDLAQISERLHLPPEYIRRTASIAMAVARLDEREEVTIEDVREAARTLNRQLLDMLATRLDPAGTWDDLVVTSVATTKLLDLERRCRHRERVLGRLGRAFRTGTTRGVRALFTGSSGTGKTLAARILARQLAMDVYRVDLAAIVNKYVGETEKNLHRVLSTAEELDVVLLIDEGDALLGSRTEVRTANDRFANLETNYLLQRLETYQGIVLVTTNAPDNVDQAFQRRMDAVVNFVEPGPLERWRIWDLHLPTDHVVDDYVLRDLAARCVMTGGQIRNAAMAAVLLALDDGGSVRADHVERAITAEYAKSGGLDPFEDGARAPRSGALQDLLDVVP